MKSMNNSGIKGASGKALVVVLALLALLSAGGYGYYRYSHTHDEKAGAEELYTCGMHPWIITDKPGDCPICGMKLTKLEGDAAQAAKAGQPAPASAAKKEEGFFDDMVEKKILFYRNPMNPEITSKVPAKDEMGMDYVPVYEETASAGTEVADRAEVRLGEDAIKRAGVQTVEAKVDVVGRKARTVGRVVSDETRVKVVSTKVGGWIEKLHVNYTGQKVEKGQPLLTLYSPELLSTQEEFLRARATAEKLSRSGDPSARESGDELVRMAQKRLELFDVPEASILELVKTGKPQRSITLRAPQSGYVTGKEVFEGTKIEGGMPLFTLTDLSRVWVEADLYEYEAQKVKVGDEAHLALPFAPDTSFMGKVTFVSPVVDPESRTIKARFEFPNSQGALKPGMFADVHFSFEKAMGVVVPDSAVMDTGARKLAFVERETGTFEPRLVEVGSRGDGMAIITKGVRAGEKVVVRANFLLDSESRLRAVISKMTAGAGGK